MFEQAWDPSGINIGINSTTNWTVTKSSTATIFPLLLTTSVSLFTVLSLIEPFENFFGLLHLASSTDREAQLVLSGLAFDIQLWRMESATNREAKLVLIDSAFDIWSTDATTNWNVEEDLTSNLE